MQKQLLLPSAHTAVLVTHKPSRFERALMPLFVLGLLIVLLGGLDLMSRAPLLDADSQTLKTAFAPAAVLTP
jgi:hypothetical protein